MKNLISFVLYFIVPNYRVGNQHFLQLVDKNLFTFLKLIFHIYDITQILVKYVLIGIGRQMKHNNISRKVWRFTKGITLCFCDCFFWSTFIIWQQIASSILFSQKFQEEEKEKSLRFITLSLQHLVKNAPPIIHHNL